MLIGLEIESLEEFIFDEVEFLVELFVKTVPISLFALAETDAVLDADTDEVNCGKREIAPTGGDTVRLWEN